MINGQHVSRLLYLVDGSCPCLTIFLPMEPDPITKLESSFAVDQEGGRKGVEGGSGVLKIEFLALTHPSTYIHCKN